MSWESCKNSQWTEDFAQDITQSELLKVALRLEFYIWYCCFPMINKSTFFRFLKMMFKNSNNKKNAFLDVTRLHSERGHGGWIIKFSNFQEIEEICLIVIKREEGEKISSNFQAYLPNSPSSLTSDTKTATTKMVLANWVVVIMTIIINKLLVGIFTGRNLLER